ncbi:MAG TPA: enolase C-terminal domain-like protein [Candidatus Saccharimonadales bacterium]|nr:enolase C-terminal domain-like protein [Candidatus Saccharimonadales bacterium]
MKITGIETRILGYDIAEAFGEAGPPEGVTSTWYRMTVDTIHTDEGIDGFTMQYGGMGDGESIGHTLHEIYAPQLIGEDPLRGEAIWQKLRRLNRHLYNLTDAIAGTIDVGLWDIRGKVANQPIAVLLGLARDRVACYATARTINPSPEQVFEEAQIRREEGYRGFKIQFWDGLERDAPRFRAARDAVGDSYPLMEDAAGMYGWTDAIEAGRTLQDLDYTWFEEPLPDRQLGQLRRLTDSLDVPILAGETVSLGEMPEFLRSGAFDIARGDVLIKNGITGLHKAATMADLFGYNLEVHGLGTPLLDLANLHVACAIENCRWVEAHHPIYYRGLVGDPLAIDGEGFRRLPTGPGLGVELDWNWIDGITEAVIRTPAG